jgi:hypothetical protein
MIKRTVKETIEKYDKDGKLVERITREESETDDETRYPLQSPTYPWGTNGTGGAYVGSGQPLDIKFDSNNPYTINCSSKNKTDGE